MLQHRSYRWTYTCISTMEQYMYIYNGTIHKYIYISTTEQYMFIYNGIIHLYLQPSNTCITGIELEDYTVLKITPYKN